MGWQSLLRYLKVCTFAYSEQSAKQICKALLIISPCGLHTVFESGGFDYMKPLRIGLLIPQTYEQNENLH